MRNELNNSCCHVLFVIKMAPKVDIANVISIELEKFVTSDKCKASLMDFIKPLIDEVSKLSNRVAQLCSVVDEQSKIINNQGNLIAKFELSLPSTNTDGGVSNGVNVTDTTRKQSPPSSSLRRSRTNKVSRKNDKKEVNQGEIDASSPEGGIQSSSEIVTVASIQEGNSGDGSRPLNNVVSVAPATHLSQVLRVDPKPIVRKITGRGDVAEITLAAAARRERRWAFVSGVAPNTSHLSLKRYLSDQLKVDIICYRLSSNEYCTSFKVGVFEQDFDALFNENLWPCGVSVRDFVIRKRNFFSTSNVQQKI